MQILEMRNAIAEYDKIIEELGTVGIVVEGVSGYSDRFWMSIRACKPTEGLHPQSMSNVMFHSGDWREFIKLAKAYMEGVKSNV